MLDKNSPYGMFLLNLNYMYLATYYNVLYIKITNGEEYSAVMSLTNI